MPDIVDWQQPPRRDRRLFFLVLGILAIVIFSSRTALSYYVDALWFGSLGYGDVFRKTLTLQWAVFAAFFAVTFLSVRYWQHTNALGTPRQIHLTGVARVLHCIWVLVADPCDAHVYRAIRAIVRRTYDLWRGDLHGCAHHSSWNARSLCCVRSRCC